MKRTIAIWAGLLLSACAQVPAPRGATQAAPFNDALFAPPARPIRAEEVFALSPAMQAYLKHDIQQHYRGGAVREGLLDALYRRDGLKLEYDGALTRNAAEAFEARAGNCLSLVIMTASFARALGLPVRFQRVRHEAGLERAGSLQFSVGHVNLTLGPRAVDHQPGFRRPDPLVVDFLPASDLAGVRTEPIAERTVVAMYMNNRAAELLAAGETDAAYWWAREAVRQDAGYGAAYNTLGVVFGHRGSPADAERAWAAALAIDPEDTTALSNLAGMLDAAGRGDEAAPLRARLARLDPEPAFTHFAHGMAAMRAGDFAAARDAFLKELDRHPDYHEFHFWLASAYLRLDEPGLARRHLLRALDESTTQQQRLRYASKLQRIKGAS